MKKTRITIRFTESEAAFLHELAEKNGMNVSEFLRQLVRNELGKIKGEDQTSKFDKLENMLSEIKANVGKSEIRNQPENTDDVMRGLIAVRNQLQKENDAIMNALGLVFPHLIISINHELEEARKSKRG